MFWTDKKFVYLNFFPKISKYHPKKPSQNIVPKDMNKSIHSNVTTKWIYHLCPNLSSWPKCAIFLLLNDVRPFFGLFLTYLLLSTLWPLMFHFFSLFWPPINSKCPKRKVEGCIIKLPIASLKGILIISWIHSRFRCVVVEFDQWLRGPSFEWAELTKMHCFQNGDNFLINSHYIIKVEKM